jgi:hypothetical protein
MKSFFKTPGFRVTALLCAAVLLWGACSQPAGETPTPSPPEVSVAITLWINGDGGILSSGEDMSISKTGAGGLGSSFTATVSGGYSGVQWYTGGFPVPGSRGTAESITIRAADYTAKTHKLEVTVTKDGALYSKALSFTVTE